MNNFISFKQWLNESITPTVNRHMTHAEDLVILGGKEGIDWVISMFKNLYEALKGNTTSNQVKLSIKFDGAPAVLIWSSFPGLEKPGIAIKGLFAKDRKVMFSKEDIEKYYGPQPDLANKLNFLFKYIPSLGIPKGEIWQGDFLFDKNSLIREKDYYAFHPNTIVYKVKKDSDFGKKISKADVGVVWHTRYTGTSLDDIKAQYDTKVEELKENPNVFMTDPYIPSIAGSVTLTSNENRVIREKLTEIEELASMLYKLPSYEKIKDDKDIITFFTTFQNTLIKQDKHIDDPNVFFQEFITYINNKFMKEMETKKTDAGKESVNAKRFEVVNKIQSYEETFILMIELILDISTLKGIFIKKLNNVNKFDKFLKTVEGEFISTGEEGFAASDINGNIVKLVDRYEFSKANFSPNIVKGWSK